MIQTLDRLIDGIPLTEYRDEDAGTVRGVMFVVHGHTGERAHVADLATRFAENGFLAVAVDAFMHGARREAPYGTGDGRACTMAMPGVILRTCADLAHLARTAYAAYAPLISFSGTSMGGHIAFQMPKHYPAKAIVPFIGTPDMMRHYAVTKSDQIGLSELERLRPELDALEIGPDYAAYMKTRIVIASGLDDAVVDYRYAVDFHDALARAGHDDVSIALYQVGHEVPAEMQEASIAALLD
ncbi:MAG: alpha/beta hydrolase [Candidatus Izemoplasmatales bacterium]